MNAIVEVEGIARSFGGTKALSGVDLVVPEGGVVVSNEIEITLDIEAILDADLEVTGAIEYYRAA